MKKFTSIDEYINHHKKWQEELLKLRDIIHTTEMPETIKWNVPVYSINGKNVLSIVAFKNYVAIWFFQGVFLRDEKNVLSKASEKTVAMRKWTFKSTNEMDEKLIKAYIEEAIQNQKDGKEVKPQKKKEIVIPEELKAAFKENKSLKTSFQKFTPSKQREFAEYISNAKQEKTKFTRLEKIKPMILNGIGLNDKYRNC